MIQDLIKDLHLKIKVARHVELDANWCTSKFLNASRIVSFARLYLPVEGEAYVVYYGQKYHLRPGFIYLIPPYAPTEVSCPKHLVKYWTNFNAYIFDSQLDIFSIFRAPGELRIREQDSEYFIRLFQELVKRNYEPDIPKTAVDEFTECGALTLLLTPFLNAIKDNKSKVKVENSKRLINILAYIEKHLEQKLTLDIIGAQFGLSSTYLTNFFKLNMGISLMKYCYNRRIKKAIDLLCYTDLSISEIVERTGTSDISNFSKKFKQETGESPVEFRRNNNFLES